MSSGKKKRSLETIGWREWVALPEVGISIIKAKVDTGARSSALHAFDFEVIEVEGVARIRFKVHPIQRDSHTVILCEAPLIGERWVRSSTGRSMLRPVIRTRIRLGERSFPTEITLVRRDLMGFRMLLGRRALRNRFLVDSGRSFLISSPRPRGGSI
jgi:hypothetical protein